MKAIKTAALAMLVYMTALGMPARAAAQAAGEETQATTKKLEAPAAAVQKPAPDDKNDYMRRVPKGFHLGGYFWSDTGVLNRTNAAPGQYNQGANYMGGRLVAEATYYAESNEFFGLGKVQFAGLASELAKGQYEAHTQDAYLMFGQRSWDLQVGRFLAAEVYHRGQGMELWTPDEAGALSAPPMAWLNTVRGYVNEAGQMAAHLYPADFMALEVSSVFGQYTNQNLVGLRPSFDVQFGGLILTGGYEYFKQSPQTDADKVEATTNGYAGRATYVIALGEGAYEKPSGLYPNGRIFPRKEDPLNRPTQDAITFGVEAAHESVKSIDIQGLVDGAKTADRTTYGAYLDIDFWKNAIGFGYHHTVAKTRAGADSTQNQAFISYMYRLPVEGMIVKAVYGLSDASIEDVDAKATFNNKMNSFRLRFGYDFR